MKWKKTSRWANQPIGRFSDRDGTVGLSGRERPYRY